MRESTGGGDEGSHLANALHLKGKWISSALRRGFCLALTTHHRISPVMAYAKSKPKGPALARALPVPTKSPYGVGKAESESGK